MARKRKKKRNPEGLDALRARLEEGQRELQFYIDRARAELIARHGHFEDRGLAYYIERIQRELGGRTGHTPA